MKRLLVSICLLSACTQSGSEGTRSAGLNIVKNNNTEFDATFARGDQWARMEVKYTPTTTFFRLSTSFNTTLAYQGTAPADPNFVLDSRMDPTDGFVLLNQNDKEWDVVQGMLDALMARGITPTPSIEQKTTTMYGGAYTIAEVLGLVMLADPDYYNHQHASGAEDGSGGLTDAPRTVWPAPGYDDEAMLPPELRVDPAQQSWLNGSCCGPTNCYWCQNYRSGIACDDWCAAGDHCNNSHSGRGCGTICQIGGCGVSCPHANSGYICSYKGYAGQPGIRGYCYRHLQCNR